MDYITLYLYFISSIQHTDHGINDYHYLRRSFTLTESRVSRNFVGIIFYTRKVLLTSHYEKRLFEYASQPRVAGSDIRLLSYLWS